jgi:GNAT superfamily N-acetyltransferase
MTDLTFAREQDLSVADYIDVVGATALGPSRPLSDPDRIGRMLAGSTLIVTARLDGQCVGLARGISDLAWVCYLGDLAVRSDRQGLGIGRRLLLACRDILGEEVSIALLSLREAKPFYDHVGPDLGLTATPDGYYWPRSRGA